MTTAATVVGHFPLVLATRPRRRRAQQHRHHAGERHDHRHRSSRCSWCRRSTCWSPATGARWLAPRPRSGSRPGVEPAGAARSADLAKAALVRPSDAARSLIVQIFRRFWAGGARLAAGSAVMPPMPLMDGTGSWRGVCTLWTPKGDPRMSTTAEKPKPFLLPRVLQGLRPLHRGLRQALHRAGDRDQPPDRPHPGRPGPRELHGLRPVHDACPEPYGLAPEVATSDFELQDPAKLFGAQAVAAEAPTADPGRAPAAARDAAARDSREPTPRRSARSSPAAGTSSATRSRPPPRAPS